MNGNWARIVTIALGAWLFFSAFAWEQSNAQMTNTVLSGAAAVVIGLLSLPRPRARLFNTALAVWIFVTAFAIPSTGEATWNNAGVGALIFVLALVRETERRTGPFGHHRRVPT